MNNLKKLFRHTIIYGFATVLPRVLTLLLTRLYVDKLPTDGFGVYSSLFAYLILGNVLLSYGMETAFFRFVNKGNDTKKVQSTALMSLIISSLAFLFFGLFFSENIAHFLNYEQTYIKLSVWILSLDALAVIPFAWLRNQGKSLLYTLIKVGNVLVNLGFNIYFLVLLNPEKTVHFDPIFFIFLSNVFASFLTLLALLPIYFKIKFYFSFQIWKEMFGYAFPVLVAGVAFAVNEAFDKIFLRILLPSEIAESQVGIYSACYKMGVFMNLFVTAYKLGVEPFFFGNASDKNAPKNYAKITEYFTIFGCFILLFITVFTDFFKLILIPDKAYWEALWIVPIILLANLCLGIYHSLSVWYKVTDRTNVGAYISVLGMAITLIFNYLLIPLWGYKGAALATLLTYFTMMVVSFCWGQKKYPIPYNIKKIFFYFFGSVITSFFVFYLFNRNIYIGIGFLFIYAFIFVVNERKFRKKKLLSQ